MLKELSIQDFGTIKSMHLTLGFGLNIVTGETGAGKSLIVDALRAVLGARLNQHSIRTGADYLHIQAVFSIPQENRMPNSRELLSNESLDENNNCTVTVSRTISRDGKSTFRLNNKVASPSWIKEIGNRIATVHGQRHQLFLLNPNSHRDTLDEFSGLTPLRTDLESCARKLKDLEGNLGDIIGKTSKLAARQDSIHAEVEEIDSANITTDEESRLIASLQTQEHGANILEGCSKATNLLFNGSSNAWDLISQARKALAHTPDPEGFLKRSTDLMDSIEAHMSELVQEIRSYSEKVQYNQSNRDYIEQRMNTLERLKRKYGLSVESILEYAENARKDLESLKSSEDQVVHLQQLVSEARSQVALLASNLSRKRINAAAKLEALVQTELSSVNLPAATFKVSVSQHSPTPGWTYNDDDSTNAAFENTTIDHVRFLLSANPGENLKPLERVVSGGETSRLALALSVVLGHLGSSNPIVFDEIDVGVSGRTASTIGKKLSTMSKSSQILCITHLPQIAAFADHHFLIEKSIHNSKTFSKCTELDAVQQQQEITAMLGVTNQANVSPAALHLLNIAKTHKQQKEKLNLLTNRSPQLADTRQMALSSPQR